MKRNYPSFVIFKNNPVPERKKERKNKRINKKRLSNLALSQKNHAQFELDSSRDKNDILLRMDRRSPSSLTKNPRRRRRRRRGEGGGASITNYRAISRRRWRAKAVQRTEVVNNGAAYTLFVLHRIEVIDNNNCSSRSPRQRHHRQPSSQLSHGAVVL